jgi:hypothetical protein
MTRVNTRLSALKRNPRRVAILAPLLLLAIATLAVAQPASSPNADSSAAQAPAQPPSSDPNTSALTSTGGIDFPTKYVFRGIVQESDSKMTLFPYGDVGLALHSGNGTIKSVSANFGIWNALMTGSSGSNGPTGKLHYEDDFYATLGLGFARGFSLATTYTAYTSPNNSFNTVHELSFKISKAHLLAPYGLVAFELDGQADSGTNEGTYLELGVGPSWALPGGKVTLGVPVKVGLSLNDYYEAADGDKKFGFFDVGALLTVPFTSSTSRFGAWNVHGGVDVYTFGDRTREFNNGDRNKVVGSFGIGVVY